MPIRKEWQEFKRENLSQIPTSDGVLELGDGEGAILYINGTPNLQRRLGELVEENGPVFRKVRLFRWEESFMYTMRESELIQQFMRQNKRLPEGNEEVI